MNPHLSPPAPPGLDCVPRLSSDPVDLSRPFWPGAGELLLFMILSVFMLPACHIDARSVTANLEFVSAKAV
jgi:hypothetical protein